MDKCFEQDLAEILQRTQNIKRELGSRVADAYLIGGEELDSCKKSLEYLLGIQQNTFLLASQVGFDYTQEGRMATLFLQGVDFTIAFERAVEAPKEKEPAPIKEEARTEDPVPFPMQREEVTSVSEEIPVQEEVPTQEEDSLEEEIRSNSLEDTEEESFPEETPVGEVADTEELATEEAFDEPEEESAEIATEEELSSDEVAREDVVQEEPVENLEEDASLKSSTEEEKEEPREESSEETTEDKEEITADAPEETKEPIQPPKVQIIGDTKPIINGDRPEEIFFEEQEKAIEEFVYESYTGVITRYGGGPQDIHFTIAPLKVYKHARSNVPILAVAQYQDRIFVSSTYDNKDGRNTVTLDVDDFSFLCRGYVDDNGVFRSNVSTTGMSVTNHDMLNMVSKDSHCPTGNSVKNGHIKFHYNGEEGEGIAEVFVLSDDEEYMLITRTGALLDYYPISARMRNSLSKAVLYYNGEKKVLTVKEENGIVKTEIS